MVEWCSSGFGWAVGEGAAMAFPGFVRAILRSIRLIGYLGPETHVAEVPIDATGKGSNYQLRITNYEKERDVTGHCLVICNL